MLPQLTLRRDTGPRPGPIRADICGVCGRYSLETRTYPLTGSSGKPLTKLVGKTILEKRKRRRKVVSIPVKEAGHHRPIRVPMCPDCLESGGLKRKQPRVLSVGITRLDTFAQCPEKYFWETGQPASYEQFRGSLTHAVLAWYTRHGSLRVRDVWNRNGPLGIKAEMLESPRLEKVYRNLLRTVSKDRLDDALLFAISTLETLVKAGIVRTLPEWSLSRKHRPLQLDRAAPEDPFRVRLSELARYYHYEIPKEWRGHDAVFPGSVDMVAYYEGARWQRKIDVPDYKSFMPPQSYLEEAVYPLQQRLYGLIEGWKFRLPWRNVTRDVATFLVFATPGDYQVKPVPFKPGDPHELLRELFELTTSLTEADRHVRTAREELAYGNLQTLGRYFPTKRGAYCAFCPAKETLCTYWNGRAAAEAEFGLRPVELEESDKLRPRRE